MLLEVCGGGLVSLVLKTSNTQCLTLALLGSAGKDMDYTAVLLLDSDIRLKKRIYAGAPGLFSGSLRIKSITENKKKHQETYRVPAQVYYPLHHQKRRR